jgi:hypothetical protein
VSAAGQSSAAAAAGTTSGGSSGGSSGGLTGTTKVVVAVVVPVVGVALIALVLLFFWKKRQKDKKDEERRRKEVEDYGFNPNSSPTGGVVGAAGARGSNGEEIYPEMTEDSDGYRGWGTTNGGRKPTTMSGSGPSSHISPVGVGFPADYAENANGGQPSYAGVQQQSGATRLPVGASPPSPDGNASSTPLVPSGGGPPSTGDSTSIITAMNGPSAAENSGIHRGISNASSNYSNVTHNSDQSDPGAQPHYDPQYYGNDGGYDEAQNYPANPYQQYSDPAAYGPQQQQGPPVIRDVQARRNTRIETPTRAHFPQGNNGIAANF